MEVSLSSLLFFSFLLVHSGGATRTPFKVPSPCGDWSPYKDEKCYKIASTAGFQTQQEAEIVCQSFSEEFQNESYPRLITIKTKEEQDFLQKFLFVDNKVKAHVWLGLKKEGKTGEFFWSDGSKAYFTNWINQTISGNQHHCVQLASGGGIVPAGSWVKASCDQENRVICERPQTITLEVMQNMFYNYMLDQIYNPVPIGFIYVQLPDQDPPTTLWPGTNWTDISSQYADLFFRVVGEKAAPFGKIQEESTSSLKEVDYAQDQTYNLGPITIPSDGWSEYIPLGYASSRWRYTRFRLSGEEVRPRNQAMKVWQRNK